MTVVKPDRAMATGFDPSLVLPEHVTRCFPIDMNDHGAKKGVASDARNAALAIAKLPVKAVRNREFLGKLISAAASTDSRKRRARFRSAYQLLMTKVLAEASAKRLNSAKGFAATLLSTAPWLVQHLENTPHFGVLQPLVYPANPRRFDYVAWQCDLALELKRQMPGLGLGCANDTTVWHGEHRLTGLELLQVWAILLSAGHLFGTFATERGLSYQLQAEDGGLQKLLSQIIERDLSLQAESIARRGLVSDFVQVLATWRICNEELPNEIAATCKDALRRYMDKGGTERDRRLQAVYQRVRQVAYQRVQSMCSFAPGESGFSPAIGFASLGAETADFFEADGVVFDPIVSRGTPMFRLMQALDSFQYRSFFTGNEANLLVLEHIGQFRRWWDRRINDGVPVESRVRLLFDRPSDWPTERGRVRRADHVLRLELGELRDGWASEVDRWLGGRGGELWTKSNFLVSQLPDATALCDVYSSCELTHDETYHIVSLLAERCEASWKEERSDLAVPLWRSIARLGCVLFGYLLLPAYKLNLAPTPASAPSAGLAMLAPTYAALADRLRIFLQRVRDLGRQAELQSVAEVMTSARSGAEGCWLLMLGRSLVVPTTSENEIAQELDGVIALVQQRGLTWYVAEAKARGQGGAVRQLSHLKRKLRVPMSDPELKTAKHGSVALTKILWPPG